MNTSTAHIFRFCPRSFSNFVWRHFRFFFVNIFRFCLSICKICPKKFQKIVWNTFRFAREFSLFCKLKLLVDTYSPTPTLICWDLSFPNLVSLNCTDCCPNWYLTLDILICYTTGFYFVSNVSTVQNIMNFYLFCLFFKPPW